MSRKEVRRRQPSGSFFMPSPIPRRACRVIPYPRCAHSVIPHFFIITFFSLPNRLRCGHLVIPHLMRNPGIPAFVTRAFGKHIPHLFIITFFSLPNRPRCGHPVIPHFDAGSREYRQRSSRTFGKLIPHFFIITFLVCSIAPDAVSQSSRTPDAPTRSSRAPTRDPGNTGKFTRKILFPGPRITCGVTRFSTRYPGYTRCLYRKKTAGSTVRASRDARTVRPESPLFFSRKRKGKAKRKLPADVRKLKNDCEVRGKRTRRARFAAAVRQALLPRALRLIRPGSNIFFPRSSLSVIFLSAFSHRPDGFALRSCRTWMRHLFTPTRLPVRFTFLDPASGAG